MKAIIALALLLVVTHAAAQNSALRIECDAEIVAGKVFVANIYVRNVADLDLAIPAGEIIDVAYTEGYLVLSADVKKNFSGESIKPSPRQVDIVVLKPNEITKIYTLSETYKTGMQDGLRIRYIVSRKLADYYNVWTGHVENQSVRTEKGK